MRILMLALTFLTVVPETAAALDPTPAQTEGPFYPVPAMKPAETDADLSRIGNGPVAKGVALRLEGRVVDVGGKPVAGARVEIWQTDHQGIYLHPGDRRTANRDQTFQFHGETASAADGSFMLQTIEPGGYEGRARHIHAKITPPGRATLTTQFYFKDDPGLARDGIARRLGKALDGVTLAPRPRGDGAPGRAATVTVVVNR